MKQSKQIVKRIVDLAMTVLLPLLMAEILIGQEIHEWLGTGMLVLFVAHHILNAGWWKSLFKGKYTPSRAFSVIIDLLLLLDMAALGISGILMSNFVFGFLSLRGMMMAARQLHLLASYWGLILMSAHLGMHMEMFMGMGRKLFRISEKNRVRAWILRAAAMGISLYGIYAFFTQQLPDYLFLQTHFVLFDETKAAAVYFAETVAMIVLFAAIAHYLNKLLRNIGKGKTNDIGCKIVSFAVPLFVCLLVIAGLNRPMQSAPWQAEPSVSLPETENGETEAESEAPVSQTVPVEDGFVLIQGGSFVMGSPEDEPWRSEDETLHTVTVSDFYISPEESNYYGHYPYEIEDNYFSQGNLATRPGEYRQTTVAVDSFSPNGWGLYNMHGNVSEWVWDYYGEYGMDEVSDPTGPDTGTRRVYRGGAWNDFAKNMRSAYRGTLPEEQGSFNIGIRLVRNAVIGSGSVITSGTETQTGGDGNILIAFFSWGGNTRGVAEEIQAQTSADLFEIELVNPYSTDYNTVLDQAQHDQNIQARPELKNHVEDFEQYDTILLGYPKMEQGYICV